MITQAEAKAVNEFCAAIENSEAPPSQSSNPILDALDLLHRIYPDERVDIWVSYRKDGKVHYTALVQPHSGGSTGAWSNGYQFTAQAAADSLIKEAGDRSKATRIAKRLAELQQEIAKLQAEAGEVA